jgi:hypothetical protein
VLADLFIRTNPSLEDIARLMTSVPVVVRYNLNVPIMAASILGFLSARSPCTTLIGIRTVRQFKGRAATRRQNPTDTVESKAVIKYS